MRLAFLFLAGGLLAACADQPVYRITAEPPAATGIDIGPYSGLWHEQARLPNRFERDCVRAMAAYTPRDDGLISVVNTCVRGDGSTRDARGRARVVGPGQLKVSFFGPFWGDYWVLARAPDYSWSIVGEPEGRYLWLLTRAERLTPDERADFSRRIERLGFRPDDLYWAP